MEKKIKYTPGPWTVEFSGTSKAVILIRAETNIARIYGGIGSGLNEGIANARLIAAAPEMLDALYQIKGLLPDIEGEGPLGTIENIIDHAIAKGRGE